MPRAGRKGCHERLGLAALAIAGMPWALRELSSTCFCFADGAWLRATHRSVSSLSSAVAARLKPQAYHGFRVASGVILSLGGSVSQKCTISGVTGQPDQEASWKESLRKCRVSMSKGNRLWEIGVHQEDRNTYSVVMNWGVRNGKMQTSAKLISEGRSVGRANERSPYEVAIAEAVRRIRTKYSQGYFEGQSDSGECQYNNTGARLPDCMLAQRYDNQSLARLCRDGCESVSIQAKLDGVRCIVRLNFDMSAADPCYIIYTRTKKSMAPLCHLEKDWASVRRAAQDLLPNYHYIFLDGELYNHSLTFQQIVSLARKLAESPAEHEHAAQLDYHVFDCFWGNRGDVTGDGAALGFEQRYNFLKGLIAKACELQHVRLVPTERCLLDEGNIDAVHDRLRSDGYEGAMIRDPRCPYQHGKRSGGLLKFKKFDDDEFEIEGAEEGTAKEAGAVIWVCKTAGGQLFRARPAWPLEERKRMLPIALQMRGKMLTVRYQGLSDDGIPRFPVGVAIRDYE